MTIRQRLAVALIAALFPILALAIVQSALAFRGDAADRRATLTLAAERSSERARSRIDGAVVLLRALGPRAVGVACAPLLRETVQALGQDYEALIRYDRIGRVACASSTGSVTRLSRTEEWWRRLQGGAPREVLEAPAGVFSAEPAVVVAVRAEDLNGNFDGIQLAVLRQSALRPELTGLPPDTDVALLSPASGWLRAAQPRTMAAPPEGWERTVARGGSLAYRAQTPDGAWRQHVVSPLLEGVAVVLSVPDPGLLSWTWMDPIAILLLPLLAWIAAAAAVWLVAERIVLRWLVYLERIASIYAKGRFSVRPVQAENAPTEIRGLARTLDEMADTIVKRDQSLRESIADKDVLMREIHHRVKNNLQIITSLLNMQQRALPDPAARAALSDTRQRITALAIIYRALYQSEDLKRVDVRYFLSDLLGQLMNAEHRATPIQAELEADSLIIDPDKLAPFALFAVEAVTNAQKHAFPDRGGRIDVRFKVIGEQARLEIADDGVGGDVQGMGSGVGRTLMTAFARQLRGQAELVQEPGGGVTARLVFPVPSGSVPPAEPKPFKPAGISGNQAAA